jgi:rRNA-processing protein FCF1
VLRAYGQSVKSGLSRIRQGSTNYFLQLLITLISFNFFSSEIYSIQEEGTANGVLQPALPVSLASDERLLIVIDTNIYLDESNFINQQHSTWNKAKWDRLELDNRNSAKVYIPQVVFQELDRQRRGTDSVSFRARTVMRFLEDKFKSSANTLSSSSSPSSQSFWELQDREIDNYYRSKIRLSGGNRDGDMQIFYFVRDSHRRRPGSVILVTNDQPLSLEAASVGVRTMSSLELFSRSARLMRVPSPVQGIQASAPALDSRVLVGSGPILPVSGEKSAKLPISQALAATDKENTGCLVMEDDDCVVTKVTRADDQIVCIELHSDDDELPTIDETQAPTSSVESENPRGSRASIPRKKVSYPFL